MDYKQAYQDNIRKILLSPKHSSPTFRPLGERRGWLEEVLKELGARHNVEGGSRNHVDYYPVKPGCPGFTVVDEVVW